MKKLSKLLAMAVTLIAVSLTGCSNLVDDATIEGETIHSGRKITLTAMSDSDIVTFDSGSGRMIMPTQIDASSSDYKFVLFGQNKTEGGNIKLLNNNVKFEPVNSSKTKGTVTLSLDVAQWELWLYVIKGEVESDIQQTDAKDKAVLSASASVDFTNADTVNFYLSPYKLKGTGDVELKIYLDGWTLPSNYDVTCALYNQGLQTQASNSPTLNNNNASTPRFPNTLPESANFKTSSSSKINPGTYDLIVTFSPNTSTAKKKYYYNDKVVVLSNQITEGTVKIPNVIEVQPAAPEKLGVTYLEPSNAEQDYYEAQFTWTDKAYNESNFVLELLDVSDVSTDISENIAKVVAANGSANTEADTAWSAIAAESINSQIQYKLGKTVYVKNKGTETEKDTEYFYNYSKYWVDGSFNINSSYAVVKLNLGRRYLARLAAVNDAGTSAYIYAEITGETIEAKEYTRWETATKVTANNLKHFGANSLAINRFRVTYDLVNGLFYESDATGTIPKIKTGVTTDLTSTVKNISADKTKVVEYGTQKSTGGYTILNPLDAPTSDTKKGVLYSGTNRWTDWLVDGDGTVDSSGNATHVYTTGYATAVSAAPYTKTPVSYKKWTGTTTELATETTIGFANIDLFATYKVTQGSATVDPSPDYNITAGMVKLLHGTTATFPSSATPATPVNGTYVYVKSTEEDTNAGSATPAMYLYACLANDATNNVVNNVGISYYKVEVDVYRDGKYRVQHAIAGSTSTTTLSFSGKNAAGEATTSATYSYVQIPLKGLTSGIYSIKIRAYADTQQAIYTYPLTFEVRAPSNTSSTSGSSTVDAETPTFSGALADATFTSPATPTLLDGTATVSDGGTITYQWYKNDVVIDGETNATYTPSETGTYKVIATNTNNSVSGTKTATAEMSCTITVE